MKVIDVVAGVALEDNKYLVARRPMHKHHGGLWEFPGGKVEPGEGFADAIEREIREELGTGINTAGELLFSHKDASSNFVIHFLLVTFTKQPVALEHDELIWCSLDELAGMSLAPTDAQFVEFMRNKDVECRPTLDPSAVE